MEIRILTRPLPQPFQFLIGRIEIGEGEQESVNIIAVSIPYR